MYCSRRCGYHGHWLDTRRLHRQAPQHQHALDVLGLKFRVQVFGFRGLGFLDFGMKVEQQASVSRYLPGH